MPSTRQLPRLLLVVALLLSGCAKALGITPVPTRADYPHLSAVSYDVADALLAVAGHLGRVPGSPYFAYTISSGAMLSQQYVWVLVVTDPGLDSYQLEQRIVALNLSYRQIIGPGSAAPDGARGYLEREEVLGEHLRASLPVSATDTTTTGTTCPPAEWGHFELLPEWGLVQVKFFRQPPGECGYTLDGQPLRGNLAIFG